MKFENLALTGWTYEKGDQQIDVHATDIPKRILSRNPVDYTYVYSDESTWEERLINQVHTATDMAGVSGKDISAYLGVHNGYKKHPEGASPVAMSAMDDHDGFMFDFSLGCASVIAGAQLAGLHFSNADMQNVLLSSVQLITQYTDNYSDGNALFADGIGAMVFSKQSGGNQIKFTQIDSDPSFRDMFTLNDEGIYQIGNLQKGRKLTEFMIKAFADQLKNSCKALQTMPKGIDYIAMSCSTHGATKRVLEAMNFPLEKTGLECMTQVPHMGTNDLIFQIEHGLEKGLIQPGSKILVTGTSLGFSIATMAIEWSEE